MFCSSRAETRCCKKGAAKKTRRHAPGPSLSPSLLPDLPLPLPLITHLCHDAHDARRPVLPEPVDARRRLRLQARVQGRLEQERRRGARQREPGGAGRVGHEQQQHDAAVVVEEALERGLARREVRACGMRVCVCLCFAFAWFGAVRGVEKIKSSGGSAAVAVLRRGRSSGESKSRQAIRQQHAARTDHRRVRDAVRLERAADEAQQAPPRREHDRLGGWVGGAQVGEAREQRRDCGQKRDAC